MNKVLIILFSTIIISNSVYAEQTWCNQYGTNKICNTYREDGSWNSQTEQYNNQEKTSSYISGFDTKEVQ